MAAITIVTGFLGSGKTTLLRRLLDEGEGGRRIALIVNEFGELGFDGPVIEGVNVARMIELSGGCVCCTVGSDFLLAVDELIATSAPDLIVVETSGLAEPWSLIRQIRSADLALNAVLTVVDASQLEMALDLVPVARWQIRAADFLILNKCDLVLPPQRFQLEAMLHSINERALILPSVRGAVDAELLFAPRLGLIEAEDLLGNPDHHADDHGALESFVWQGTLPLERAQLDAALATLPTTIYRAKGIVHCSDAPWPMLVNLVAGRVDFETVRLRREPAMLNALVFIGPEIAVHAAALGARLDACVDPERAVRWLERQ
jgi:G3E family GTPase